MEERGVVDEFERTGLTRQDQADMADIGKRQQLNVSRSCIFVLNDDADDRQREISAFYLC